VGSVFLTDLADVLRRAGCTVREHGDWQYRARGSGGYEPGRPTSLMIHHTASPPSWSGQRDADYCTFQDEDAPLANLCLDRDGVWWVLAGGATNTNGKGADTWGGGVPNDSMNSYAIGCEANGGYGSAWPDVQCEAYVVGSQALCAAYRIPNNNVRGHFEWAPTRKVDPAGPSRWSTSSASWDMGRFRADVAATGGSTEGGDDMPLSDDDIARIWNYPVDDGKPAKWWVEQTQRIVRNYLGGVKEDQAPPATTMLRQIYDQTKK